MTPNDRQAYESEVFETARSALSVKFGMDANEKAKDCAYALIMATLMLADSKEQALTLYKKGVQALINDLHECGEKFISDKYDSVMNGLKKDISASLDAKEAVEKAMKGE